MVAASSVAPDLGTGRPSSGPGQSEHVRPGSGHPGPGGGGPGGSSGSGGRGPGNGEPPLQLSAILRRLWPYLAGLGGRLILAALAVLATAVLSLTVPAIIRHTLDSLVPAAGIAAPGSAQIAWGAAALIILVGLAEGLASFVSRYLMEGVGFRVVYRLRADLYRHLHELSFEFHDNARIGDIMSRLTADTEALSRLFGFALPYIAANTLTIIGAAVVLLLWQVNLGLSFVLLLPLMLRAMRAYAFQVQLAYRRSQQALGRISEVLRVVLSGIREVKLFGQEEREHCRIAAESEAYLQTNLAVARISAYWMPHVSFLVGLTTAVALAAGGREVILGRASLGTLVAFLSYAGMLMRPIRQTGMLTAAAMRAAAAARRVLEVIDEPSGVQEAPDARPLPPVRGEVRLENVTFAYADGPPVLDNISFTVAPGEVVAIVGPTGAGKTTLVHLIPRFYDPQAGSILIDGVDIRTVTLSSLRGQVGTALQSVFLFGGTVRENIAFGRPEATLADIQQAARLAQIHDEIEAMPQGYDTPLGERAAHLSGGQRQRLALARVLLTDPRVLILDEISSELDAITESRLRRALAETLRNRTTLVIAHRLWTVQQADRIVVLDQGRIVETGTHDELLAAAGLYREIYTALVGEAGQTKASAAAGDARHRDDAHRRDNQPADVPPGNAPPGDRPPRPTTKGGERS